MLSTQEFACHLPKAEADALNRESGRVYSNTLTFHYRTYRHTGHWLSPQAGEKVEDALGGPTTLHAHSRDAAQQGFYAACKTARTCRKQGQAEAHYPHRRKTFRPTVWKNTGLRVDGGVLRLARAQGLPPVEVRLPEKLAALPASAFREVRLVWDRVGRRYRWQVVIEDGQAPPPPPGQGVVAVDLGEIHPVAATDGQEAVIFSARQLRSTYQYTAKRLAELRRKQDAKQKGSRRWKRLQRRKNRFQAQQKRRVRDIQHKVSRAAVNWAVERQAGTLVIGDVRDVADGKRLNTKSQQKW